MKTKKRFLSILLSLVMVLGLISGMSLTAYADDPYASLKNTTTVVHFDSKDWYLIDYDSTTVTLLAKECVAASQYNSSGSYVAYDNDPAPTVKSAVDSYYNTISDNAKTAVSGGKMFLLTTADANATNADVRKCSQYNGTDYNGWWLCSQGINNGYASFVAIVDGDNGDVYNDGGVKSTLGVRPALKLDLSKVAFDSTTNTFSVGSSSVAVTGLTFKRNDTEIDEETQELEVGESFALTAVISPEEATDKTVKWSVSESDIVGLYSDAACKNPVTLDTAIEILTVYVKGLTEGPVQITVKSNNYVYAYCTVSVTEAQTHHTHSFTYSASGGTITATCSGEGDCDLTNKQATLTIAAEGGTYDGKTAYGATVTNSIPAVTGDTVGDVAYYKVDTQGATTGGTVQTGAPTGAGYYYASVTLTSGSNTYTAVKAFTIAKATSTITTVPTAGEITYGQTLANSTLTGGEASVAGSFGWKDSTVAPAVTDSQKTEYDVVFTPTDGNYGTKECKVKLTVNKADSAVTKAPEAKTLTFTGSAQELVTAGEADGGKMQYALGTKDAATEQYTTSIPAKTDAGTYYVWYKVVGDEKHNDTEPACVTSTISTKTDPAPAKVTRPSSEGHPAAGTLDVAWKAAEGAKSYEVQWRKKGGKWQTQATKSRKLTVSGLKKGTLYEVRVRAKAGSKAGEWSPVVRRWLRGADKVRAKSGSKSGTVKVSWKRDAKATGGTKVYVYAKKGGKLVKTATAEAGKTSVTVEGLKAGKRYFVRVRPLRKASGKTYSGTLCGYKSARAAK